MYFLHRTHLTASTVSSWLIDSFLSNLANPQLTLRSLNHNIWHPTFVDVQNYYKVLDNIINDFSIYNIFV